ncbi:hypothetical protein V6N11_039248 [Hibiscus sabdariffa]|uniref:Uncharacterized protein n=1 Tax=Hibiscus sabdariffa TaxID=183260 RepID=A0ABR2SN90_9ROSI
MRTEPRCSCAVIIGMLEMVDAQLEYQDAPDANDVGSDHMNLHPPQIDFVSGLIPVTVYRAHSPITCSSRK